MRLLRAVLSKLLGRRMRTTTGTETYDLYVGNTHVTGGKSWTSTEIEVDQDQPEPEKP